jgi:hypothetical protein
MKAKQLHNSLLSSGNLNDYKVSSMSWGVNYGSNNGFSASEEGLELFIEMVLSERRLFSVFLLLYKNEDIYSCC